MKLTLMQTTTVMVLWSLMYMIKFKHKSMSKTMSPFECGYNNFLTKLPLSIQFTLLAFMFLLFDVELSILISSIWSARPMTTNWILSMFTFLICMMISIMYEMMKKSVKWK